MRSLFNYFDFNELNIVKINNNPFLNKDYS